ncbi:MAG: glycosyl transferase family 4 [Candidatus Diapherotrites archaeon]
MIVAKHLIPHFARRGIVGFDMNKTGRPKIPELGGLFVVMGFSAGVFVAIFLKTYVDLISVDLEKLLAAFATIIMMSLVGLIDDISGWKKGLKQWQHALIPIFAALPLMVIEINNPPINLPFIGQLPACFVLPIIGCVSFGLFYSLVLVPIGVTGASNAANMLAGLNGLEAGLLSLIIATLIPVSLVTMHYEAFVIGLSMLGALLSFLFFNWYPAKVFGGDTLTLTGGATIAAIAIVGDMEKLGVFLMSLYFVELLLKARSKFKGESFGIPQKDGTLKAPEKICSLTHVAMRLGKFKEYQVVMLLLVFQAIVCIFGLLMFYFRLF